VKRYVVNVLVVLDVALNVILFASRDVETLSRRAAKAKLKGKRWGCVLCGLLDRIAADHCTKSLPTEIG
jgi:hypothetical protein